MHPAFVDTTRVRLPVARPRFVPWTVPAWLPPEVEGPATFVVGVLGGLLLAFCFVTLTNVIIAIGSADAPSEPSSRAPAALERGARTP